MRRNMIRWGFCFLVVTAVFYICSIAANRRPDCYKSNCDMESEEGSSFCSVHGSKDDGYVDWEYDKLTEKSKSSYKKNASSSSNSSSTNSSKVKSNSSKKTYNPYESYDEGYEDVYENDDYDWDRYYSDDDYAAGVDEAMDELDW